MIDTSFRSTFLNVYCIRTAVLQLAIHFALIDIDLVLKLKYCVQNHKYYRKLLLQHISADAV